MSREKKIGIKSFRTVLLSVAGDLLLAPTVWLFLMVFLGAIHLQHLGTLLTDPVCIFWLALLIAGSLSVTAWYTRKILADSYAADDGAPMRCARGIRYFVPIVHTCILIFCLGGVFLAIRTLDLRSIFSHAELYGLGIGAMMLTILPLGIHAYNWLEKHTSHQNLPENYIPLSIPFRLGIIGTYIAVGTGITLVSASIIIVSGQDLTVVTTKELLSVLIGKLLAVSLLMTIFALINIMQFFRLIIFPIREMDETMERGMSGDFTVRGKRNSWDDFGILTNRFNNFIASLQEAISKVLNISINLGHSGEALKKRVSETAVAVDTIEKTVDRSGDRLEEQRDCVLRTGSAIKEISGNIELLDRSIEEQTANFNQSSSAVEEMVANVAAILRSVHTAAESVASLRASSQEGREQMEEMDRLIRDISGSSAQLMEANSLISGVAAQTNLLAMNAAIEAAHAGDAGRGFSVVADEIRKLAETSTSQSSHIAKDLQSMAEKIEEVVQRASSASESFQRVFQEVEQVHQVNSSIVSSMEQQRQGGDELLEAISALQGISSQVQEGSRDMNHKTGEISSAADDLRQLSDAMQQAMAEIAEGAKGIGLAVSKIEESEAQNTQHIEACKEALKTFTVS